LWGGPNSPPFFNRQDAKGAKEERNTEEERKAVEERKKR
jgi:hypothetical protein